MSEYEILVPKIGDEPPQRKRKSEYTGSSSDAAPIRSFHKVVEYNSWEDDDYVDPAVEKEYYRQVRESDGFDVDRFDLPYGGIDPYILRDKYDYSYDMGLLSRLGLHCYNLEKGTNLRLIGINKYNSNMLGRLLQYYITLEATDTSNSLCNFQTCVCKDYAPDDASFMVHTEISRLKVPAGPRTTFVRPERKWKDDAVDDFYKGKMPTWFTQQQLSDKGQFYELQESDWQGIEWLHMYAEFAFYSKGFTYGDDQIRRFLPLEMKKIMVQTTHQEDMILKANNAIFYISFKANGDPSVEYQAIVRRTMDGMPGHISLEVDCSAYKST